MRYFMYGNGGGIDEVRKEISKPTRTYGSLKGVFEAIVASYFGMIDIQDLSVHYYCYDDRIEKDVYIILTNRCGDEDYIKKYKCPQFVKFLVNV